MISKKGKLTNLKKSPFGEEEYDSALEREYMVELERDAAVVKWTKKHGIKIPYTFLGFRRHYLPDFLVEYRDGTREIHETKGLPLLLWLSTKLKRQSAEAFCQAHGFRYKQITKGRGAFYGKV
ncbi:MAG: TnsA endonuclease N-terminal domain-containing protein [Chthonomonadales bacterium]